MYLLIYFFFYESSHHTCLADNLLYRFETLWVMTFPKAKIAVEVGELNAVSEVKMQGRSFEVAVREGLNYMLKFYIEIVRIENNLHKYVENS